MAHAEHMDFATQQRPLCVPALPFFLMSPFGEKYNIFERSNFMLWPRSGMHAEVLYLNLVIWGSLKDI